MADQQQRVSRVRAVKSFLEQGPNGRPVTTGEFKAFWDACSEADKTAYAANAAAHLGVVIDDSVAKAA